MTRTTVFLAVLAVGTSAAFFAYQRPTVGKQADGSYLVSTGQRLTPVGKVTTFDYQRPKDLAVSPGGQFVALLAHRKLILLDRSGTQLAAADMSAGPRGVVWSPDGKTIYASGSGGKVVVASWADGKLTKGAPLPVDGVLEGEKKAKDDPHLAGLAISPDGRTLFAAMTTRNAVAVVDLEAGKVSHLVATGVAPYEVELSANGHTLAVCNRGGSRMRGAEAQIDPNTNKPFEGVGVPTADSAGTAVQIDARTDAAARGSVSLIDTTTLLAREVAVGRQPSGLAFGAGAGDLAPTLYVSCSDSDDIFRINLSDGKAERILSTKPNEDPFYGTSPTDLGLSKDGRTLYVCLGGLNAVGVYGVGLKQSAVAAARGYVPTGWYPICLGLSGDQLIVGSSKGIGSHPSNKESGFGVHDSVGMVQSIGKEDLANLRALTARVAANNNWQQTLSGGRQAVPVPRPGQPSVFKHVVYIIKENLTYDSALGDMKEGNGDPSLCTFPEEVTPNHHALAREFVLLDNFYTSGTNSADGHQWASSSIANEYSEQNYATNVRSYPYDGGDPLAYSAAGFIWTAAKNAGKSVRVFGEFVNKPKVINPATGKSPTWSEAWADYKSGRNGMVIEAHTDNAALRSMLHPNYIGFPSIVSDQWRADTFLSEFRQWESAGKMPDLSIMLLPNNHTSGTSPRMPTPRAMVADNDLALGRIVEAITKSRFWKETLILVVEDDSQTGIDHVDGHRSIGMVISPYTRRHTVVSDIFNHTSFVRTMELVLGIPPMNRFDAAATPLRACFWSRSDSAPYTALPNNVPLDQMNPPAKQLGGLQRQLAEACEKLDWSDVDRADAKTVAKAIWYSTKPHVPFPEASYHPPQDGDRD